MHNNTLNSPKLWYVISKTWRDFGKISLETFPSCIEFGNFERSFQNFGKSQTKCSLDGRFCRIVIYGLHGA